jgi:hypothetical protein
MTTSSTSEASRPLTRSEWVSTLPPWRRLLATFNWRPVYDIEQETEQLRMRSLESERRDLDSERRTKQIEKEIVRLEIENKRLSALESRMDALLLNADSSSQTPPCTGFN